MSTLTVVSCSGADDGTDIGALIDLAVSCPLMEVSIQISHARAGTPGFPTQQWVEQYTAAVLEHNIRHGKPCGIRSALHVNDRYGRELLHGSPSAFMRSLLSAGADSWLVFSRIQFNFYDVSEVKAHSVKCPFTPEHIKHFIRSYSQRLVFQYNQLNANLYKALDNNDTHFDVLFDESFGDGVSPKEWPSVFENRFCAYSGGLGPESIEREIHRICKKVDKRAFGIDAHGKLRGYDNSFSLQHVASFLSLAQMLSSAGLASIQERR